MLLKRYLAHSLLVLAALLIGAAGQAQAAPLVLTTTLTGGQEVPPRDTPGIGTGSVTLDGNLMTVSLTFSGLRSPTADSHIHCCAPPGANAGVAVGFTPAGFPLGVTSGSFTNTFDLTVASIYTSAFLAAHGGTAATAAADLIAGIRGGQSYLNIHTTLFPGGELRGQVVPEPGTMLLLGTGILGIGAAAAARRRRKSEN